MTIHGIGVDLLHVPRMAALVQRKGANKVASRILSRLEHDAFARLSEQGSQTRFLGVRWAVKEAAYKALYPLRPTWKDLTYTSFDRQTGSKPTLVSPHAPTLHVSVSHDGDYVLAYVVAEH